VGIGEFLGDALHEESDGRDVGNVLRNGKVAKETGRGPTSTAGDGTANTSVAINDSNVGVALIRERTRKVVPGGG
jgi:hypothetical protein